MTFRSIRFTIPALAAVFAGSITSEASLIFSEYFDYTDGALATQNGGTGFASGWTGAGNVTSPGLLYAGLLTAGGKFTTAAGNQGAFRDLALPINVDNGVFYVSFLTSLVAATPDYAGLSFFTGTTEELFLGKPSNTPNYGIDASGGAGRFNSDFAASTDTTLLVYRLTFTPDGDTIDLFLNPPVGGSLPETPTGSLTVAETAFPNDFNRIRIQSGNAQMNFDEVRAGTSYADVAPVPEPSTVALLGLGALALGRRRRRAS